MPHESRDTTGEDPGDSLCGGLPTVSSTEGKHHGSTCTFLFAGGITQRKGIKYLLEAWDRVRRPGWKLQLLGALPESPGPLSSLPDQVELLGRIGHSEMPARMAAADVFVFPSLFEGSAVVTYEALACGLPGVVTPAAGSVVRDGIDGFVVKPRDVTALARRMEQLGHLAPASSPDVRGGTVPRAGVRLASISRLVLDAVNELIGPPTPHGQHGHAGLAAHLHDGTGLNPTDEASINARSATMQRVKELDSIRGLAALTIVIYHLWFPAVGVFGLAVDLFFVLSGYLITTIILDNALTEGFLFSFYVRRSLRIWPVYYLTLAAVVLMQRISSGSW